MMRGYNVIIVVIIGISIMLNGCNNKDYGESSPNNNQIIVKESTEKDNSIKSVEETLKEEVKEETKVTEKETKKLKEINGFIKIQDLDESILVDLRYATKNNFTGKKIYPNNVCVLRKETAEKLAKANAEFKERGYRIKVWDAYRPVYVQKIFWDIVKDSRFVANPKNGGSKHNKGTAVDITLVDKNGKEIIMPTDFDNFTTKAYRSNPNVNKEVRKNVDMLTKIMKDNGFIPLNSEWWHFDDSNSKKYKITDIKLEKFLEE